MYPPHNPFKSSEFPLPKMRQDSAGDFIEAVVETIREMEAKQTPECSLVAVMVLANGGFLPIHSLRKVGHNAVVVTGTMDGRECKVVVHQAALQVLTWFEKTDDRQPRPPIGFLSE